MPTHDWTRVPAGLFHDFHQCWTVCIKDSLNDGGLPPGHFAIFEQKVAHPEPEITAPVESDGAWYAAKANRISIRHPLGEVVAVIEIISPGNKDSRNSIRSFVEKAVAYLRNGIHLLIVDLFPPSDRDPQGIHKAIWDELTDEAFALPVGKNRTLVSYQAVDGYTAYIEPLSVGDRLPQMPLFLERDHHVLVPLEATYDATWELCLEPIREMVQ